MNQETAQILEKIEFMLADFSQKEKEEIVGKLMQEYCPWMLNNNIQIGFYQEINQVSTGVTALLRRLIGDEVTTTAVLKEIVNSFIKQI